MKEKSSKGLYDKVRKKLKGVKSVQDYDSMCRILDEFNYDRTKATSKKQNQLEQWKLCFTWTNRKGKFTNIKIYSEEEYYANVLKYISKKVANYNVYAFFNLYAQYSGGEICYITKNDLAMAICLCNEDFKNFQKDKISVGVSLEDYVSNLRESRYKFIAEPKKEIKEHRESNSENEITKRTYHIINDYNLHVSENNAYFVESTLKQLTNSKAVISRDAYIGGVIDIEKLPLNPNLSLIFQEGRNFYYPLKNSDPLIVQFKERPLTPEEINTYVKIQGEIIHDLGFSDYFSVKLANKVQDLQKKMFPRLVQELKVLFVYQAYEAFISPVLVQTETTKQQDSINDFLNASKLKSNLFSLNKSNQQKILDLKQQRQDKELTIDSRNVLIDKDGNPIFSNQENKTQDDLNKQYALFLYEKLNRDLVNVDMDTFIPDVGTLSLENCPPLWKKLFNKSLTKVNNNKNKQ